MKRATLYSRNSPSPDRSTAPDREKSSAHTKPDSAKRNRQVLFSLAKHPLTLMVFGAAIGALVLWGSGYSRSDAPPAIDETKVESIVLKTLATKTLPSRVTQIAEQIWPSVVKIRTLDGDPPPAGLVSEIGKGTGFVIKDDGSILTNYHVVAGSERIVVTFADGLESPAAVIAAEPERDLAVLTPARFPDDLKPVVLAPNGQAVPGDLVVAVGFPFGMGPSVSAGVISGLDRTFRIPNAQPLTGLIQFDAAVNPGSSGGPLVNQSGEVLGVVTAILNPSPSGTFAGVGFAITMQSAANAAGIPPF